MRRLYWLRARLFVAPSEGRRLLLLTASIGVTCGLAAVAFHLLIRFLERNLIERALDAPAQSWIAWTLLTPVLGGLVCGYVLHRWVPGARGSGIPEVKAAFGLPDRRLRMRDALGKFGVASLQIGTGASLGREGPTVHICGGLAAMLGRFARLSPRNLRRLLPVGAAAGVAAAFNAPIAAVTFTIEEIVGDLDKTVLSGVVIAAAIAAVIERSVLGIHPVFDLPGSYGLEHVSSLTVYVLLGIAAALVAVPFTDSLLLLRKSFRRLPFLPAWMRPAVGGLVAGLLAFAALELLHTRGITGGGYSTLERALNGDLATFPMLLLCGMKVVATSCCYASGGSGGIFAPALFIGGMLGGAIGELDGALFGHAGSVGSFALVGMGAVFAASIRAPITSVLIIVEMTGGYSLILPLMIANMIAYGLAHRLRPTPIYDALLEQDGVQLPEATGAAGTERLHVADVLGPDAGVQSFAVGTLAHELLRARRSQEVYPVLEPGTGRLVGLLTDEELNVLAREPELHQLATAGDVMRPPVALRAQEDLRTALETMLRHRIGRVPVVDEDQRVLGLLDDRAVSRAFLRGGHVRPAEGSAPP